MMLRNGQLFRSIAYHPTTVRIDVELYMLRSRSRRNHEPAKISRCEPTVVVEAAPGNPSG
jgi:hypothetical protein